MDPSAPESTIKLAIDKQPDDDEVSLRTQDDAAWDLVALCKAQGLADVVVSNMPAGGGGRTYHME